MKFAASYLLLLFSIIGCSIAVTTDGKRGVRGEVVEKDESESSRHLVPLPDSVTKKKKKMMTMSMKKKDVDDKKFRFFYLNKDGDMVTKENGCDFVSKMKKKRCAETINGEKVSDKCAKTCKKHQPKYDDFVLEGTRTYVGCDSYVFAMKIQCGVFGDNDPDLCLVKSTFIGLASNNGTFVVGTTRFDPFVYWQYGADIFLLGEDAVCVASGVFSRKRVKDGKFAPTPMISSDGCANNPQGSPAPPDYMFVMKGELATDGSNDMKIDFSSDYGYSYYTENFNTPGVYRAYYHSPIPVDKLDGPFENPINYRRQLLSANNIPGCFGSASDDSDADDAYCLQHEISANNPSWIDLDDPDSQYYDLRNIYFDLVMGTDRWVANGFPDDFAYTRNLDDGPTSEVKICRSDGALKYEGLITNEFPRAHIGVGSVARTSSKRIQPGDYIIRPECVCVPRCMQHPIILNNPSWTDNPDLVNVYFDINQERWEVDGFPDDYRDANDRGHLEVEVNICKADGSPRYNGYVLDSFPTSRIHPWRGVAWLDGNDNRFESGDYINRPECECSSPSPLITDLPSVPPTMEPTMEQSMEPTKEPTVSPTFEPTKEPTVSPTFEPTKEPTKEPTVSPTFNPTKAPTAEPTNAPSNSPIVTQKFPITTARLRHGLCLLHSSPVITPRYSLTIDDPDRYPVEYREITRGFTDGVQLWGDRSGYVAVGLSGQSDMCEGGLFLQSSRHWVNVDAQISISIDVSDGPVRLFAFVEGLPNNYNGGWDLTKEGFTETGTFAWNHRDASPLHMFEKSTSMM